MANGPVDLTIVHDKCFEHSRRVSLWKGYAELMISDCRHGGCLNNVQTFLYVKKSMLLSRGCFLEENEHAHGTVGPPE